uniref:Putative secreted protein n=1 Tax=Anopheles darlingi TaxID=43151 RepID=A0A2M4DF76_ANODA
MSRMKLNVAFISSFLFIFLFACLCQLLAETFRPIGFRRIFRNENVISFDAKTCHYCQVAVKNMSTQDTMVSMHDICFHDMIIL